MAGRLRVHTEKNRNALTLPDYFTYRFEDKSRVLRILSALVILLFFTIYCASGVVAGARLFESTFGMSYDTALWVGAAATITYTFFGGFLAVSWTDTVQATLMIFALILTPVFVIIAVGGVYDPRIHLDDVVMPVLKKWRIFERDDFTGEAAAMRDDLGLLIEELEDACEKFEVAKQRRLERERLVAEKKAMKNLLVSSSSG